MGKTSRNPYLTAQTVICLITVTSQISLKLFPKECFWMVSCPGPLIIKEYHLRCAAVTVCQIYPHLVFCIPFLLWFTKYLYPGFITVDVMAFQEHFFHTSIEQFQIPVCTADDPVRHCLCRKVQVISCEFPFLSC